MKGNRIISAGVKLLLLLVVVLGGAGAAMANSDPRTQILWWAPDTITEGGARIDWLLNVIYYLTGGVFLITQVVYVWFLIQYRRRPGHKAVYSHGNNRLELIWTVIPAGIFLWIAIYSNRLWADLIADPGDHALEVEVVAYQFGWHVRNPGLDNLLAPSDNQWVSSENRYGVALEHPDGMDDFATENLMVIPVNRPVRVVLRSLDVIHAFYVPEVRMYQDAIPGKTIRILWFKPIATGDFEIACNQLCGVGHYAMKARLRILPEAEYAQWVQEQVETVQKQRAALAQPGDPAGEPGPTAAEPAQPAPAGEAETAPL